MSLSMVTSAFVPEMMVAHELNEAATKAANRRFNVDFFIRDTVILIMHNRSPGRQALQSIGINQMRGGVFQDVGGADVLGGLCKSHGMMADILGPDITDLLLSLKIVPGHALHRNRCIPEILDLLPAVLTALETGIEYDKRQNDDHKDYIHKSKAFFGRFHYDLFSGAERRQGYSSVLMIRSFCIS